MSSSALGSSLAALVRVAPPAERLPQRRARISVSEAPRGAAPTLVVVEHKDGRLGPATLPAVSAAAELGGDLTALVAGEGVRDVARAVAGVAGVGQVLVAENESLKHQLAEPMADLLAEMQKRRSFSHVLAPATTFGKNLLPRFAALVGVQPISDIIGIAGDSTYSRPIYAGNAIATVRYTAEGPQVITVRPTSFPAAATRDSPQVPVEDVSGSELSAATNWSEKVAWEAEEGSTSDRPELGTAKVVVSGGRALKSAENFKMLERLADMLGGAVGASRAAVDSGFVPNDYQVGQTGKVVAPDLYIAVGISGAIQHLAGIKDAKVVVAINTDSTAPIFQVADYGLEQDLFTALPELEQELAKLPPRPA
ncbi:unnamed protein product [Ostreobium quekettii]|uniref:Electron transfer flavoprotein subunit alpha n=1 Tax=Ostreobium quekettii TaxID=121088 RepID=A0A8S1IUM9_9CHLO|nr:unnamed protein product [Ostreobium quekettii]|eukprot:evm.model.scf_155.2 EVM.evm.TU.scf_155.2   scf_155:32260-36385(-)